MREVAEEISERRRKNMLKFWKQPNASFASYIQVLNVMCFDFCIFHIYGIQNAILHLVEV